MLKKGRSARLLFYFLVIATSLLMTLATEELPDVIDNVADYVP